MKNVIIYATKYGCAEQAAIRIKKELPGETDLINIMKDTVPSLQSYDTVILGGSVYVGRVQKQLTAFINSHLAELQTKKIGLYLCAGAPDEPSKQKELETAFPEALAKHAAAMNILGYAFCFEKMKFFDKLIMSKIKGDSKSETVFFDDRIKNFIQAMQ